MNLRTKSVGIVLTVVLATASLGSSGAQEQSLESRAAASLLAQRGDLAESILAAKERALGEPFDASIRASLKGRMEALSMEQLKALAQQGELADLPWVLGSVTSDLVYTPVTPCRVFDCRISQGGPGPIPANTQLNVFVVGIAGFPAQGGTAGGCGVPVGATSAIINFVTVQPAGPGNIRAWAVANPQPPAPLAAVMNYGAVTGLPAIANGVAVPLCNPAATSCALGDLRLQADTSATDILGDVVGYFRSPAAPARGAVSFTSAIVPMGGAPPTTAGTITITPTVTGPIQYRARGYCNVTQQATTNLVSVFIGANSIDTGSNAERAFLRPPLGAGTLNQIAWTAERSFAATAGVAITTSVFLFHPTGAFIDDCSGTFTAEQLVP